MAIDENVRGEICVHKHLESYTVSQRKMNKGSERGRERERGREED